MSDQDLFVDDKNKTPSEPQKKDPSPQDFNPLLGMIVNQEGKPKYSSVEEALKGAAHAQVHITNLEKELAELKAQSGNAKKIEDVIAAIKQAQHPAPADDGKKESPDVYSIVKQVLSDVTSETTRQQNITTVTSKFKELYGEKASETLYGKANDLGMSKEDINALIAKNPNAALKLLGVTDSTKKETQVPDSKVDTSNFQGTPPSKPKSIMGYVSAKDLTQSWLESKQRTLQKLGIEK